MDKDVKENVKNLMKATEMKLAKSILRWKYKKEGKEIPGDSDLQARSRMITEKANQVLSRSGKSLLKELKEIYRPEGKGEGRS